jgi:hypothetical protein
MDQQRKVAEVHRLFLAKARNQPPERFFPNSKIGLSAKD